MYLWISGSRHSSNGSLYMKPVHGRVVPSCTQAQANLMSSSSYGSCTIVVITNLIFAPVLVVYNRLRVLVLLLLLLLLLLRTTTTTRPVPLAGPTFLACLRKMVMIRMLMRTMMMMGCVQTHFGSGWGAGGLRGAMMTTLLRRHPEQYLQKNRFTRYLQYFRVVGPSYTYSHQTTSGLCELDLGISESFLRKLELGRGDACFGDDDDIVLRTPRTICAHTPHTTSKAHPPTPRSGL